MLDLQKIIATYPPKLHRFRRFLLREYLQYQILNIIFEDEKTANKLCFLGGTCIRLIHDSQRFSEDLDFDSFDLSKEDFVAISALIKKRLEQEGFKIEIKNVLKGAFHCYIRFPELLYPLGLSGYQEEKILIKLDTQAQLFDFKPQAFLLNKFEVFQEISVTPVDLLLAQKCYTIFNRKRKKGRDFFDTVFLFGKTKPNYDYLQVKAGVSNEKQLKDRLLTTCNEVNLEEMAKDVQPFLFNPSNVSMVKNFEQYIRQIL